MKRDMDLVRLILMQVEEAEGPVRYESLGTDESSMAEIAYHVELMQAQGLLDAKTMHWSGKQRTFAHGGTVDGLTWDGHDYLDAIRDDGVWRRTKQVVREAVGDTTMSTIKQAASMVAMQLIKSNLGM